MTAVRKGVHVKFLARALIAVSLWLVCGQVSHEFVDVGSMGRVRSGYTGETAAAEVARPGMPRVAPEAVLPVRNRPGTVSSTLTDSTIPQLITAAAIRHHVQIGRALDLAWAESQYTDAVREEENGTFSCGPLQVNNRYLPGMCEATLEQRVDAGVGHFARLIRQHGAEAEYVYRFGHRKKGNK